jgi:hypothetical protein
MTDDEPEAYATQDEALAAILAESEPGDLIEVHDEACPALVDEQCDCEVLVIQVGGTQA